MLKNWFRMALFVGLVIFPTMLLAAGSDLISQADQDYAKRDNVESAKQAKDLYQKVIEIEPNNYEAYWKLARCIWYIEDFCLHSKNTKEYQRGIDLTKQAIVLNGKKAEAYYWLGVMYGVYGESRGVVQSLFLVGDMEKALKKAAEIDPNVEGAGPYRVLGRLYYELPGSKKKSLDYLLKAKELGATQPGCYIYLADTYLALNQKDEAKKALTILLNMEPDQRWIPETKGFKKIAQEKLKKL